MLTAVLPLLEKSARANSPLPSLFKHLADH
jgi:hypothetical protein